MLYTFPMSGGRWTGYKAGRKTVQDVLQCPRRCGLVRFGPDVYNCTHSGGCRRVQGELIVLAVTRSRWYT